VVCYNTAISACGKAGKWEKALELLRAIPAVGLQPDTYSYGAALSACENAAQWQTAESLLDEMTVRENLEPNEFCLAAVLSAYEKGGEWERALALFREIKSGDRFKAAPNIVHYNAAITAAARGGQWAEALAVFHHAQVAGSGVSPDLITYTATIEALEAAAREDEAMELMFDARDRGLFGNAWNSLYLVDLNEYSAPVANAIMRCILSDLKNGVRAPADIEVVAGQTFRDTRFENAGRRGKTTVLPQEVREFMRACSGMVMLGRRARGLLQEATNPKAENLAPGWLLLEERAIVNWLNGLGSS